MARSTTRSEWPWIVLPMLAVMSLWYLWNRSSGLYPGDVSEGGRLTVITYGTDRNPSRQEQIAIFNRAHRAEGLVVVAVPGGNDINQIKTVSAGRGAPDVIDVGPHEDLRDYARLGIAVPIDQYLAARGVDLDEVSWPQRVAACRIRHQGATRTFAVPNNVDAGAVWFNRSMYQQAVEERRAAGVSVPPEPWLDWTWWDYAAIGRLLHRRGADGRFRSFGASVPDFRLLYLQHRWSTLGDGASARPRDYLPYGQDADGTWLFPDRGALADVLQFCDDLVVALEASPSGSDESQMASGGTGFGSSDDRGRFNSGQQGLCIAGRWNLGGLRPAASFEWRLLRLPRWVPYAEWERWQREGKGPGRRDGAWGDADAETRRRGFASTISGRMTFVTGSSRHPELAARFLEFLVTNRDFSRALAIEDGMGARRDVTLDYLSKPDPDLPGEAERRPVAHELGALERVFPSPVWPYANYRTRIFTGRNDVISDKIDIEAETIRARLGMDPDHRRLAAFGDGVKRGYGRIGASLAAVAIAALESAAEDGRRLAAPPQAQGPKAVSAFFFLLLAAMAVGWWLSRRRQGGAHA